MARPRPCPAELAPRSKGAVTSACRSTATPEPSSPTSSVSSATSTQRRLGAGPITEVRLDGAPVDGVELAHGVLVEASLLEFDGR